MATTRTKQPPAASDPADPKPDDPPADPPKPDADPASPDESTVKGWIADAIAEALKGGGKPDDPEPIVDLSTDKKLEAFTEKLVRDVMEHLKKAEADRPPPPAPKPEPESVPERVGIGEFIRTAIWGRPDE